MDNNQRNEVAERSVLASLITEVNNNLCKQALDMLTSDSFSVPSNRIIFNAIKQMADDGLQVDPITITDKIKIEGNIMLSGGFDYINGLKNQATSSAAILSHVDLLNKLSLKREIIMTARDAIAQADGMEVEDLVKSLESSLSLITAKQTGKTATHISDVGPEWLDNLEQMQKNGGGLCGLETGITGLDEALSGFDLEGLIILAGRPSHGKTLMAQTIMDHVSNVNQKNCLFFSMEMSKTQVYSRFLSKASGVCPKKMRSGVGLDNEDWGRLNSGIQSVNNSKIYFNTESRLSVGQIRARARAHKAKFGYISLITIDYLGLMAKPKADRNDIAIGEITSSLKALAKEFKTPVLLLVQGGREMDKNKRPTMSDLKDSSSIEADADVVMFVHRQEVADPETELKGVTELIIVKDRHNDGNGTIYLSKVKGGFNEISQRDVAFMVQAEEAKNKPIARGYKKNG